MTGEPLPAPPDEYAGTAEVLQYALARVRSDKTWAKDYLEECEDALVGAKMRYHEAVMGERALEKLLAGDLYQKGGADFAEEYQPKGWAPPYVAVVLEPTTPEEVPPAEPEMSEKIGQLEPLSSPEILPAALVEQLTPAFVQEHNIAAEEIRPEMAEAATLSEGETTISQPPAAEGQAPVRGPYAERVDYKVIADKVMAALDEMLALWPEELDGQKVSAHLGEKSHHIYPALKALAKAGQIQYLQRLDRNQVIVLRLGDPMPHFTLTKNQQLVFDWLAARADGGGLVSASVRSIEQGIGCAKQTAVSTIWPLQQKGYLEIIDKGDSKRAATYRIVEQHRHTGAEIQVEAPSVAAPAEIVVPEPVESPKCDIGIPITAPPELSPRKIARVKALLEQGWTLRAAAAHADVDYAAVVAALGETA